MAGLKASTESSGPYKKTAAKAKKGKPSGKAFALSEEYVVDSDSDGGIEDPTPSRTPIASVKASEVLTSKAKIIVTPPTTASKSNGSSKLKNVDQSAKKYPGGSVDSKANGNTPRNVKQVENKPSKKPETSSTQVQGGPVTAAEKPGAKPTSTSTSKANLPAGRTQQKVVESQDNSQEEDEETDGESTDSTGSEGGITKKTAAQPPSKPQSSSSKATTPKASAPKRKLASPEPSESSTSDESSSDEESPRTNDNVKRAKQPQTPSQPVSATYKPPTGFSSATISQPQASDLPNLLSPTNLASKQVWHLTLPAAIPISAIKATSMDRILRGGTVVTHNGSEYGFFSNTKTIQNRAHVFLPNPEHNDYRAAPKIITRSLHLQQMLNLPTLGKAAKDNATGSQAQRETGKVVHEQPSGLKMRYAPLGDESGTLGFGTSSDEDREPRPPEAVFRMPPSLGTAQLKDKRRENGANNMENTSPLKSSPKKRRIEEVKDDVAPETPLKKRRKKHRRDEGKEMDVIEETPAKTTVGEKRHTEEEAGGHNEPEAEAPSANGVTRRHEGETPEEKAKRKVEKHQREDEHNKRKEKKRKKTESQESARSVAAEA